MKFLNWLLIILILTGCSTMEKKNNVTQSDIDYAAENIIIKTRLVENKPNNCPIDAPFGFCYRVEIELTNTGNRVLNNGVEFYFTSIHPVLNTRSDHFKIEHINGDLHRITMTDMFPSLSPKESVAFNADFPNWIVNDTDFFPNYYAASGNLKAKVVTNTVPIAHQGMEDLSGYTTGIQPTPNQMKRIPQDKVSNPTALSRFKLNKTTTNMGADYVDQKILPTAGLTKKLQGRVSISGGLNIKNINNALSVENIDALNQRLQSLGVKVNRGLIVEVSIKKNSDNKLPGSYELTIKPEKISVSGSDPEGAFYGVESIASLITLEKDTIPSLFIKDEPRYSYRGMHLDVARNFHSKALVKILLDQMAAYKLNKLHFHLSDDEGWRLEIEGLPELTEIGSNRCHNPKEDKCLLPQLGSGPDTSTNGSGYFSRDDYKEILKYASARHIQVIPSMDMPGHARAAIKSMEARYRKYIAKGDKKAAEMYLLSDPYDTTRYSSIQHYKDNTINPCMESSFIFIDKVIYEIKKLHEEAGQPLVDYHIGADETTGAWIDSPACRAVFVGRENDINNSSDVGKYFIERISHILERHNLNLAAWNDGLDHQGLLDPKTLAGHPKAYVWSTLFWGGAGTYDRYATKGYDVVVSTPDSLYFDMPYEADPKERGYYWATRETSSREVFGFMPDNIPANVETQTDRMGQQISTVSGEKAKEFLGMQGHIWSETIRTDDQVEYMAFPRMLALAERAWHKAEWEPAHKKGVTYKTNSFGYKGSGHLTDNIKARDAEWIEYANLIGHKVLPKLDRIGINYRLPVPGGVINNKKLSANVIYPGLMIEYSVDGGKNWRTYNNNNQPTIDSSALIRSISTVGRAGRSVEVPAKQ